VGNLTDDGIAVNHFHVFLSHKNLRSKNGYVVQHSELAQNVQALKQRFTLFE
jgi:hypothetical protein